MTATGTPAIKAAILTEMQANPPPGVTDMNAAADAALASFSQGVTANYQSIITLYNNLHCAAYLANPTGAGGTSDGGSTTTTSSTTTTVPWTLDLSKFMKLEDRIRILSYRRR